MISLFATALILGESSFCLLPILGWKDRLGANTAQHGAVRRPGISIDEFDFIQARAVPSKFLFRLFHCFIRRGGCFSLVPTVQGV